MKRIGNGMVMALIGVGLAASAVHWLITPMDHPDASNARVAAVLVQALIGVAALAWGWRQHHEDRRTRGPHYEAFASGVVCLIIGAGLAGTAMHWLITPMSHPDVSSLRTGLVWGQVLLGIGLMAFSRPRLKSEAVSATAT